MKQNFVSLLLILAVWSPITCAIISQHSAPTYVSPRTLNIQLEQTEPVDKAAENNQSASPKENRKTMGFPFLPSMNFETRQVGDMQEPGSNSFIGNNGMNFAPVNPMDTYGMNSLHPMMNPMMNGMNPMMQQPNLSNPLATEIDYNNELFDDIGDIHIKTDCRSVKKQAIEIANTLMKKQNHKVFKELMSYLVKNKFLIGMTEIKLTKHLRKRLYGLMSAFSSLQHHQLNFVDPNTADVLGAELYNINDNWIDQQNAEPLSQEGRDYASKQSYPDIDDEDDKDIVQFTMHLQHSSALHVEAVDPEEPPDIGPPVFP
jgi:hypothetical protein